MPYTVYGLLKGIRNHRIDSPHVTGRVGGNGRPNACNLCHLDRTLGWAARQARRVVQAARAERARRRDAGGDRRGSLSGDAVLRAIAAWHFGWDAAHKAAPATSAAVPYLVAALGDPYSAVRYVAGHALAKIDPAAQFDYLAPVDERRRAAREDPAALARQERGGGARRSGDRRAHPRLIDKRDDSPVRAME